MCIRDRKRKQVFSKALAWQTFSKRGTEKSGEADIMIKIFAPISEYALKISGKNMS